MKEIKIEDKLSFLKTNYPFGEIPSLTSKKKCIHCDLVFQVKDFKVFQDKSGFNFICCPNAPKCSGTVIDWFNVD